MSQNKARKEGIRSVFLYFCFDILFIEFFPLFKFTYLPNSFAQSAILAKCPSHPVSVNPAALPQAMQTSCFPPQPPPPMEVVLGAIVVAAVMMIRRLVYFRSPRCPLWTVVITNTTTTMARCTPRPREGLPPLRTWPASHSPYRPLLWRPLTKQRHRHKSWGSQNT